MRKIGSTDYHATKIGSTDYMGSVIYGKIYSFGGHTNKPVKKPTH
jgi:hypothetical protein